MSLIKRKDFSENGRVKYIRVENIDSNPGQPRRSFDREALIELSESIRQYGVLQPLTVRRREGGRYELVAGERRLRALRMAGLLNAPCIVMDVDNEVSSLIALVENLQRRDLDFFEEAAGIQRLISKFGLSQEEAARRVGKSQSAVANKLRLLRLSPPIMSELRENGLSERHARALLRLEGDESRETALRKIIENRMNVSQTDEYIDKLVERRNAPPEPARGAKIKPMYIIKDIKLFLNTINRAVGMMREAGVEATTVRQDTENDITLTIHIPKRAQIRNISGKIYKGS